MNVHDQLTEALRPYAERDSNGHLSILLGAIAAMIQPLADLVSDDPDTGAPGWSSLVDINRSRDADLGYLAQFVGVKLLAGLPADAQRARVASTDGWKRGTVGAMIGAAQQHLTGDKTVVLRERYNPDLNVADAYHAQIITRTIETPDPAQVIADVNEQDPAGIVLHFAVVDGQDWLSVRNNYPTWTAVRTAYGTWQAVRDDIPS